MNQKKDNKKNPSEDSGTKLTVRYNQLGCGSNFA